MIPRNNLNSSRFKHRTDYTKEIAPKIKLAHGEIQGFVVPKPDTRQDHAPPRMKVSIKIMLPAYHKWRLYKFARQYPYLTAAATFMSALVLVLFISGLNIAWHTIHPSAHLAASKNQSSDLTQYHHQSSDFTPSNSEPR